MEKKMNIRGTIRQMNIGDALVFKRGSVLPSYVRAICTTLKQDYNIAFSVEARAGQDIIVTRYA